MKYTYHSYGISIFLVTLFYLSFIPISHSDSVDSTSGDRVLVPDKPQPLIRVVSKAGHNCRILGWWNGTGFPDTPDWVNRRSYVSPDSLKGD